MNYVGYTRRDFIHDFIKISICELKTSLENRYNDYIKNYAIKNKPNKYDHKPVAKVVGHFLIEFEMALNIVPIEQP